MSGKFLLYFQNCFIKPQRRNPMPVLAILFYLLALKSRILLETYKVCYYVLYNFHLKLNVQVQVNYILVSNLHLVYLPLSLKDGASKRLGQLKGNSQEI